MDTGLSLLKLQNSRLYSLNSIFRFHSWSYNLAWISAGGAMLPKVSFLRPTVVCWRLPLVHLTDTAWLLSSSSECLSNFVVLCLYWCSWSFFARISSRFQIANNTKLLSILRCLLKIVLLVTYVWFMRTSRLDLYSQVWYDWHLQYVKRCYNVKCRAQGYLLWFSRLILFTVDTLFVWLSLFEVLLLAILSSASVYCSILKTLSVGWL